MSKHKSHMNNKSNKTTIIINTSRKAGPQIEIQKHFAINKHSSNKINKGIQTFPFVGDLTQNEIQKENICNIRSMSSFSKSETLLPTLDFDSQFDFLKDDNVIDKIRYTNKELDNKHKHFSASDNLGKRKLESNNVCSVSSLKTPTNTPTSKSYIDNLNTVGNVKANVTYTHRSSVRFQTTNNDAKLHKTCSDSAIIIDDPSVELKNEIMLYRQSIKNKVLEEKMERKLEELYKINQQEVQVVDGSSDWPVTARSTDPVHHHHKTCPRYRHAEKEYADRNVIIDNKHAPKHTISTQTSIITGSRITTVTSDKHGADEDNANKETDVRQIPLSIDLKNVEQLVKNTYEELIKFKDEFQHRSDLPKPSETTDPSNKLSINLAKQLPNNESKADDVSKHTSRSLPTNSKSQKKSQLGDKKPSLIRNTTVNRTFLLRRTLSEKSFHADVKNTSSLNRLDTKGPRDNKIMKPKTLLDKKKPLQSLKSFKDIYEEDNDDQIDFANKTLNIKNKTRIPFRNKDEELKENILDTFIQNIDVPRINTPSDVSLDQDDIQIVGKSNHSSAEKPGLPEAEETPKSIASKKDLQKLTFVNLNDTFSIEPDIEPSSFPSPMKTQISLAKTTSDINLVTTGIQCSNLDETNSTNEMVNKNKLIIQILPKIDIKRTLVTQKIPNLIIEPTDTVVDIKKPDNIGYMEVVHDSAKLSTVATQIRTQQQLSEHHDTTLYKDLPETTAKNVEETITNENVLKLKTSDNEEHKIEQVNINNVSIFKRNQDVLENRCAAIKKRLELMRQYKFQNTMHQNITENRNVSQDHELQDTMLNENPDTGNQKAYDQTDNEGNSSVREENIQTRKTLKEIQSRLESQCATIKTRLAEQRKINFADALSLRRELTLPPRWQNKASDILKTKSVSPKSNRISKKVDNSKEEEYNAATISQKADSYATSSAFMSEHSGDFSSNRSDSTSEKIQPVKLKDTTSNLNSSAKEKDTSITTQKPVLKESEIILEKLLQKHDKQVADQVIQTDRILVTDQNTQYSLRSLSNTSEDKIVKNITSTNINKQTIIEKDTSITSIKLKGDNEAPGNMAELGKVREININELEKDKKGEYGNLEIHLDLNKTEFSSEKPGVIKSFKSSKGNVPENKRVHFETVTSQFCISPDEKLAEDFTNNVKNNDALEGTSIKQTMVTEDELQEYAKEYNASRNINVSNTNKSCQYDDAQGVKEMKDTSIQCSPPLPEPQTHPDTNLTQTKTIPVNISHTVNKPSTSYEQDLTGPRSSYLKLLDSYKLETLNSARFKNEKVYSKYKKSSTPLVSTDTATTDNDTEGTSLSEGEVKLPCKCSTSIGEIHLCRFANDIKRRTKIMKQNPETRMKENVPSVSDYKQYDNWLAYMTKSENTISGDTNSYISSITSNYTSETGS